MDTELAQPAWLKSIFSFKTSQEKKEDSTPNIQKKYSIEISSADQLVANMESGQMNKNIKSSWNSSWKVGFW